MLNHLHIVDFAIIEEVELSFEPGLNVITGETGAGKSMIVGAAGLLRGNRSNSDIVRKGAKEAVIEAVFDISDLPLVKDALSEAGLNADDELLIRRVIPIQGRSRIWINGSLSTSAVLVKISRDLLDISGQHEYQSLSDRQKQLGIVDELALDHKKTSRMVELYQLLAQAEKRLSSATLSERERIEKTDFLRFQLEELERAQLKPDEDLELDATLKRLRRASDLLSITAQAEEEIYSKDGSLCEKIAHYRHNLEELSRVDEELGSYVKQLNEAYVLLEDAAHSLAQYSRSIESDPQVLSEAEERFELIHRLCRKHGGDLSSVIEKTEQMREELDGLESWESKRLELERELEALRDKAARHAGKLSDLRSKAATALANRISERLSTLGMKGANFNIDVTRIHPKENDSSGFIFKHRGDEARISAHGWDRIDFRVSTNAGEDFRSIGKVASGGELSRLMLALRQVLGEHQPTGTSVFDEVDAGISGAVADVVGASLAEVAEHRQVLVVTHLPQVAAYGDAHFHVGKSGKSRSSTHVKKLDSSSRVEELAQMLAGEKITKAARENAKQLLDHASERSMSKVPSRR